MPTISTFYGIIILMHLVEKEHKPPHIHAIYGDNEATFSILTGEKLEGAFPRKGQKLVRAFIKLHKNKLLEMWSTGQYDKLPGLE